MAQVNDWEVVDANNNAAPPDGWPENTMQYSEVNNTGRQVQGAVRRMWGDLNGSLAAGGVADAYTVTLNSAYTAYFQGMYFACEIMATNTGASTIDVNGIGVQNVVQRDGSALPAGVLDAGGIYEFRYDGTDFQLMGTLGSNATLPQATLTNSNAIDLVDTDVALRVGASDPDTQPHIEVDFDAVQAKADATTNTQLDLNPRGGVVQVGSNSLSAAQTLAIDTGAGLDSIISFQENNVQAARIFHDASANALKLRMIDAADQFIFEEGNATNVAAVFTPNGAQVLNNANVARLQTTADGADVLGTLLDVDNSGASTLTQMLARNSAGGIRVDAIATTANGRIAQTDSAGALEDTWINLVRNGSVQLFHNNNVRLTTNNNGVEVVNDAAQARVLIDAATGFDAALRFQENGSTQIDMFHDASANIFRVEMQNAGEAMRIEDTSNIGASFTPNGEQQLRSANAVVFETQTGGVQIRGDATDVVLSLRNNAGTQIGFIRQFEAASGALEIRNTNGGNVSQWDANNEVTRTTTAGAGGLLVNNTLTGAGFERVLTASDLGGGGGNATLQFDDVTTAQTAYVNTTTLATMFSSALGSGSAGRQYRGIWSGWGASNTPGTNPGLRWRLETGAGGVDEGTFITFDANGGGSLQIDRGLPDTTITGIPQGSTSDEAYYAYEHYYSPASSSQTILMQGAQSTANATGSTIAEGARWTLEYFN